MALDYSSPWPGIDGPVMVARLSDAACCPPTICEIDLCALACSFVHDLPSGPLWDRAKMKALNALQCGQPACDDPECGHIVLHAIYSAHKLRALLLSGVWPQLREANPATAYDTLDDWLERLGWEDCFKCACGCVDADGGQTLPPFQLLMPDGRTICCPDEAPAELTRAVKKGIVLALWRLRLGIVPTLDAINFVISSLGAELVPDTQTDPTPCCRPQFIIRPTADTLPCATLEPCPRPRELPPPCTVQAYWLLTCNGDGDNRRIYPGVLAAECIVRSILSDRLVTINRSP